MNKRIAIVFFALGGSLTIHPLTVLAASSPPKVTAAQFEMVLRRLDAVEQENRGLRERVLELEQKVQPVVQELPKVTEEAKGAAAQQVAPLQKRVDEIEHKQRELPFEVGFRQGFSESPYGMPGGFFFGAYLNHRLLTEEDGIPGGDVTGELFAGMVLGNHRLTHNNLANLLVGGKSASWLNTVEIQPTAQYSLDMRAIGLASLESLRPYVLGGPGIWISMMSTPEVPMSGPGHSFRHYDADPQGGGVFGVGLKLGLDALKVPAIQGILDKTKLGTEYRFNEMGNGEGFNQYTGSVSFGF